MKKMDIIYEDKELLVVNKPSHMLTISDGKSENTIYSMAREYVKKQHKSNKIFIVHRLDKKTSGLLVLAKSMKIKKELQDSWNLTTRKYIGITERHIPNKKGTIKIEEKPTTLSTKEELKTLYEVLNYTKHNTVLSLDIKTGKKNQIRASLENLGYPLVGDKLYGSTTNPIGRLGLHANYLKLIKDGREYEFYCEPPKEFLKYLKK